MMRHFNVAIAMALWILAGCAAPRDRNLEVEAEWLKASRGFDADVRAFMVRYRTASEEEQRRMLDAPDEPRHKWTPRMRELAVRFRGDCAAVRFDRWLLLNGALIDASVAEGAAARIVERASCGGPMRKVPGALRAASRIRGIGPTLKDLDSIARRSPDPAVRAEARRQADLVLHPAATELRPGMPAPLLRGADFEGKPVDSNGAKNVVVLVDFWGAWCGPCLAKLPAMKRIASRYAGAPFAIVGVNSDRDPAVALQVIRKQGVAWKNIADGGTSGPIAKAWKVSHWPSVFVVDRAGRIAAVEPSEGELVSILDRLLGDPGKEPRPHAL